MAFADQIALPLVVTTSVWAVIVAWQAHRRSFPWSLLLVAVAIAGWAAMVREGMIHNFTNWLAFEPNPLIVGAAVVVAAGGVLVLSRRGVPGFTAGWLVASLGGICVVSLTVDPARSLGSTGAGLQACLLEVNRWVPTSLSNVFTDALPNAALYAPLGYGLAAIGWMLRRTVLAALLLSGSVELYQGLTSERVCAPRDVIFNVVGMVLGLAVLRLVCRGKATPPSAPPDPRDQLERSVRCQRPIRLPSESVK